MYTAKVSTKGWIVIPKGLREKYGLKEGTRIQVVDYGNVLLLVPLPKDPIGALYGMLAGGPPLTEALMVEREQERKQEERWRE